MVPFYTRFIKLLLPSSNPNRFKPKNRMNTHKIQVLGLRKNILGVKNENGRWVKKPFDRNSISRNIYGLHIAKDISKFSQAKTTFGFIRMLRRWKVELLS